MSKVLIAAASRVELLNLNHEKPCAAAEPSSVSRKIRRLAFSKPASKDFSAAHKKSRRPDTRLLFFFVPFFQAFPSFLLIYLRYIVYILYMYASLCVPPAKNTDVAKYKNMFGYSLMYILIISSICVF